MSDMNDNISLSSANEDGTVSNLVIDQMDKNKIVDHIYLNCHKTTSTPWTSELIFPSSINGVQSTNQGIFIVH